MIKFGNVERLKKYGKRGCHQGGGVFTSNRMASFTPKSQSEIINNARRIGSIRGKIESSADVVRRQGLTAKENFLKYLEIKLPVCGVWDRITYNFNTCMKERNRLREPMHAAGLALDKMTNARRKLYADYAELMEWAPSGPDWTELCSKKLRFDSEFSILSREITKAGDEVGKKIRDEEAEQAAATRDFDAVVNALEKLLQALQALLDAIMAVFDKFLSGVGHLAKFVAAHPTVFWAGTGFVALTIVAFIFRPYFGVITSVLGLSKS